MNVTKLINIILDTLEQQNGFSRCIQKSIAHCLPPLILSGRIFFTHVKAFRTPFFNNIQKRKKPEHRAIAQLQAFLDWWT